VPSLLPPQYVNVPVELLYELDVPASVLLTAVRIYGLGWRHRYERTDPVSLDELMKICEVSRSTLYGHLVTLGDNRVLRYTTVNVGRERTFVFELLMGTPTSPPGRSPPGTRPDFWTDPAIGVVVDSPLHPGGLSPCKRQQHTHAVVVRGESEGGRRPSRIPDGRSEILDGLGILEPTRSELLALEHVTERHLSAWADWFNDQEELGVGWLVTQIRVGVPSPPSREAREEQERQRYLEWGRR